MTFKTKLINKDKSYTFSDYFSLNDEFENIIGFFNYSHLIENNIFKDIRDFEDVQDLKEYILDIRKRIPLNSETAKREFLIAPLLVKLIQNFKTLKLLTEKTIIFNNLLKGKLDYLLSTTENFLIIEAKNDNMENGYKQLAVEMIALDKIFEEDNINTNFIYGVISTGIQWKFVILNREKKEFLSDLEIYLLPRDLEKILGIFVEILKLEK
ncbi:MAG: hypothetical protein U9Q30_09650 [Campylobacterota bacterium]|nr:hypothetical protein [Campylobacterota bacterium]